MGRSFIVLASVLVIACTLGACAPMTAPPGLANDTPAVSSDYFLTRDGLRLPLRHWDAEHPKAIIVALHGMSDYSEAFDMPAPYWAQHGITTYAYDQRSFGRAPHPGIWPGGKALREDLEDCVEAVRERNPGLPVFALGESMGGAVVLSAMADPKPPRVDGVILVAPAVWSRDDMPLSYRVALWLTAHIAPSLELSGKGLHIWPSDNIEMLRKLSRDPLFQKHTRADAVWGLVNLMDAARKAPLRLPADTPPILYLYGDKDQIVPRAPTVAVAKELGKRAEVHEYPDGYHMLLRDLDGPSIWKDIVTWVDKIAISHKPTA
ncbi:MAG: lysophospholipase [Alphaproteobacteria bacterium]|nr:lysophospholipase [Alphaproteobacteria bacterium]MDE1987716.1 lysophospholipase [Alphaproteobacteria bacterium]MDE2264796.1 lysophospholipase [Alphaproteobacteria bacterium]